MITLIESKINYGMSLKLISETLKYYDKGFTIYTNIDFKKK